MVKPECAIGQGSSTELTRLSDVLYQYFLNSSLSSGGGEKINPVIIGAIADAIATVYIGYKVGQQIDKVGDGVKQVLYSIAQVLDSVSKVIDKANDIIGELHAMVAILGRKFDESIMRSHINLAAATVNQAMTTAEQLQMSIEKHNIDSDVVETLVQKMDNQQSIIYTSIYQYINQETDGPSYNSLITCAPFIATWAQLYTQVQRHRFSSEKRVPPWQTHEHLSMLGKLLKIFRDIPQGRETCESMLKDNKLQIPNPPMLFADGNFIKGRISKVQPIYSHSFYGDTPSGHYAHDGFHLGLCVTTFQSSPDRHWRWTQIDSTPDNLLPNPEMNKLALQSYKDKHMARYPFSNFLATTEHWAEQQFELNRAMSPQPGWE